ncbi:bromodomain adjacent to zinc finger domain protein 1A isoform X2 [Phlebotomus papatasi]|uniref:bromodomain adjacent to zinc finger domain protein 1A isoform X2 n=1 Tax=Phlebotomus papatasi TaxID=29031 RepID=UPI0024842923|nr:bromodomain adjacent to zinc finger domain protein 1A isoform X2 [Phlebotomus papatasi]
MPLMKRKEFKPLPPPDDLKDNEEVFYCPITKEVFRKHEDYFERVMLINSMLWTCALTGKTSLTYTEALESEQNARETLCNFSKPIKTAVVIICSYTRRSGMMDLIEELYSYMKDRYFKGEEVIYCAKGETEMYGKILGFVKDSTNCAEIEYKVQLFRKKETKSIQGKDLRRHKTRLTREKLKFFLKDNTEMLKGALVIKGPILKKYTNNSTIKFENIHIGKPPVFETSSRVLLAEKQPKKQAQISKYFAKDGGRKNAAKLEASNKEIEEINRQAAEKLAEMQAEEQKRLAEEREKQRQELNAMVQSTARAMNAINEDLLLQDQKVLPSPKSMELLVPKRFYGDFLMVLEFIHSFSEVLQIRDKFPKGVTIPILQRAFLTRDVAGPLSDIVQVLLATIFSLQMEEQSEVVIRYRNVSKSMLSRATDPIEFAELHACRAMKYSKKYFSNEMADLPMDATTVSEILRLHILSSGAQLRDDQAVKWRFQTRGGYRNTDDPGLLLRLRYAHIIRALSDRTIYELPLGDIFKILDCLISQIMTYSSVRDIIDDRIEKATKSRMTMKAITYAERRRLARCETEKKDLREEAMKQKEAIVVPEGETELKAIKEKEIDDVLQKKLDKVEADSARAKKQFMVELEKNKSQCFDYQLYLGSDRAHRKYWLFNSLPGLFVEHSEEDLGSCFDEVTKNIPELVNCPSDQRYRVIKQLVTAQMKMNEKENNRVNGSKVQPPITSFNNLNKDSGVSQRDLWMCTAKAETCPVHNQRFPDKVQWSYFHTSEEIDALTTALNPRGFREKPLREQFELERELIVAHVITCPHDLLQVNYADKDKILASYVSDQKRYESANFQKEGDINNIMSSVLCDYILDLEWKISEGYLGVQKGPNRQLWRDAVASFDYKLLKNGIQIAPQPKKSKSKDDKKDKEKEKDKDKDKEDNDEEEDLSDYEDPGTDMPDSLAVESEDSSDEAFPLYDSHEEKKKVHFLATALIQVKRTIDTKYLKWPYGVAKEKPKFVAAKLPQTVKNLHNWETALAQATNYSQVFLHYNILYDSILWSVSASHAACQICRRKSDPEKMLLCDECNSGCHMFCLKPPLTKVPEGDWFCTKCKKPETPVKKKNRKIFKEESSEEEDNTQDDSEEDNEEDEDDDGDDEESEGKKASSKKKSNESSEDECDACQYKSGKKIKCLNCPTSRHAKCVDKNDWVKIGKTWECCDCKNDANYSQEIKIKASKSKRHEATKNVKANDTSGNSKKNTSTGSRRKTAIKLRNIQPDSESQDEDEGAAASKQKSHVGSRRKASIKLKNVQSDSESQDEGEEEDVAPPPAKKRKQDATPRRSLRSQDDSKQDTPSERNAKKLRRSENLPLDSVALYALLDAIAKHPDSWPFNRPVAKVEVPDYYDIIKNPMDFAKIKSKLNCGDYATNEMLIRDIEQVFQNCDAYNNSDSKIYQSGIKLERFVMEKCAELKFNFKHSDMISDDENEVTVIERNRSSRSRKK